MSKAQEICQSIWFDENEPGSVSILDQRYLPHKIKILKLRNLNDAALAIRDMAVRGAPLIGVTAAYGLYLGALENRERSIAEMAEVLLATRPTAINLKWALDCQIEAVSRVEKHEDKVRVLLETARRIEKEDIATCHQIGLHGLKIIESIAKSKQGRPVNILTHCNAGWLACVKWGTKTSPIYHAHQKGIPLHIWVDETRPRNQGAHLTAWELGQAGIDHRVIADNLGGLLMQKGDVDLVLVGTDRTARNGDVANKVGTYLKALAAFDNQVPFYVCLPSSTIDWDLAAGVDNIPIEERHENEIHHVQGVHNGEIKSVRITPEKSRAFNLGFDITPARLITGLITERGITEASEKGLLELFPEKLT